MEYEYMSEELELKYGVWTNGSGMKIIYDIVQIKRPTNYQVMQYILLQEANVQPIYLDKKSLVEMDYLQIIRL